MIASPRQITTRYERVWRKWFVCSRPVICFQDWWILMKSPLRDACRFGLHYHTFTCAGSDLSVNDSIEMSFSKHLTLSKWHRWDLTLTLVSLLRIFENSYFYQKLTDQRWKRSRCDWDSQCYPNRYCDCTMFDTKMLYYPSARNRWLYQDTYKVQMKTIQDTHKILLV